MARAYYGSKISDNITVLDNGCLVCFNVPIARVGTYKYLREELAGEQSVGTYHAGNIWNCRCYPEPLLEVDDVKWPHKVYIDGQIKMMNKNEFMEVI